MREKVIPIRMDLHEAVRRNDFELVKKVAAKTTKFNEADENGRTPLMVAAEVGNNVIANFLMSKGASMHSRDNDGKTAIEIASENESWGVVSLFDHARGWNRMD
jgi:ankyrin repeat protein